MEEQDLGCSKTRNGVEELILDHHQLQVVHGMHVVHQIHINHCIHLTIRYNVYQFFCPRISNSTVLTRLVQSPKTSAPEAFASGLTRK